MIKMDAYIHFDRAVRFMICAGHKCGSRSDNRNDAEIVGAVLAMGWCYITPYAGVDPKEWFDKPVTRDRLRDRIEILRQRLDAHQHSRQLLGEEESMRDGIHIAIHQCEDDIGHLLHLLSKMNHAAGNEDNDATEQTATEGNVDDDEKLAGEVGQLNIKDAIKQQDSVPE
ncbi:uncharacterized protein LY89DRAFT_379014 [Mollisia scopiformis]|uniref:Uncharacterized protein n=1 Tax=Mollisia scopiformis TaxID=149040 RepID=A0A194XN68_MOLSC|nr:uncharacterized protein LY89DRAFT_379014 [Mollisia scopiformis]KUJ21613.1 hypothetical protein LY89DRAFT_379014 [Mollisia scopiformis]